MKSLSADGRSPADEIKRETGDSPSLVPAADDAQPENIAHLPAADDPHAWILAYPEQTRAVLRAHGVSPSQHPASHYINANVISHFVNMCGDQEPWAADDVDVAELREIIDGIIADLEEYVEADEQFFDDTFPDGYWCVAPEGLVFSTWVGPDRRRVKLLIERERLLEEWPGAPGVSAWIFRLALDLRVTDFEEVWVALRDAIVLHYPDQQVIDFGDSWDYAYPIWQILHARSRNAPRASMPQRAFLPGGAYAVVRGPIDPEIRVELDALLDQVRALGVDVVDRRAIEKDDYDSALAGWGACVQESLRNRARNFVSATMEAAVAAGQDWPFAVDEILIDQLADEERVREVLDRIGRGDEFERLQFEANSDFEKPEKPKPAPGSVH